MVYNRALRMREKPFLPRRRSVRLETFDYSQPAAYFLTICVRGMAPLFGKAMGNEVALTPLGSMASERWLEIPSHFPHTELGPHVVMPNHLHGIVIIRQWTDSARNKAWTAAAHGRGLAKDSCRRPHGEAPGKDRREFASSEAGSIPIIVGAFKSAVSRAARVRIAGRGKSIWQRGYYEHILWDKEDFRNACEYIRTNPARQALKQDREPW